MGGGLLYYRISNTKICSSSDLKIMNIEYCRLYTDKVNIKYIIGGEQLAKKVKKKLYLLKKTRNSLLPNFYIY